jgi:hypothetical protein
MSDRIRGPHAGSRSHPDGRLDGRHGGDSSPVCRRSGGVTQAGGLFVQLRNTGVAHGVGAEPS